MTRGKIPPATALVLRDGPPDAALVKDLRLAHWRNKGRLETAAAVPSEQADRYGLAYDRPTEVDAEGSYLIAEELTYEIVGALRQNRYYLAKDKSLWLGIVYLLIPMSLA